MKINIDPFCKALLLVFLFSLVPALTIPQNAGPHAKMAKIKSRLKQIGTTVAMYYSDRQDHQYPQNPSVFDIEPEFLYTNQISNWFEISLNSPYIFFPNTDDEYTQASDKPLAMNWEHLNIPPYYQVVWEDGHVSSVTPEEAQKLINSSIKNRLTQLLYKLTFKNNQALQ